MSFQVSREQLEVVWCKKSDEEVAAAAKRLIDYTEDAQQVIREEMHRRYLSAPDTQGQKEEPILASGRPPQQQNASPAETEKTTELWLFLGTAFAGLLIWLTLAGAAGEREAWDALHFFTVGLPTMMAVAAIAGFLRPGRAFFFGFGTIVLQPVALLLHVGKIDPLLFVGLLFFLFFALLCSLSAFIGGLGRKGSRNSS